MEESELIDLLYGRQAQDDHEFKEVSISDITTGEISGMNEGEIRHAYFKEHEKSPLKKVLLSFWLKDKSAKEIYELIKKEPKNSPTKRDLSKFYFKLKAKNPNHVKQKKAA